MHTPIRNVTYKGSIVHREMKSNITKARDAVENGDYSSIDQFYSEMNYIIEKYDVARFSSKNDDSLISL